MENWDLFSDRSTVHKANQSFIFQRRKLQQWPQYTTGHPRKSLLLVPDADGGSGDGAGNHRRLHDRLLRRELQAKQRRLSSQSGRVCRAAASWVAPRNLLPRTASARCPFAQRASKEAPGQPGKRTAPVRPDAPPTGSRQPNINGSSL